LCFYKNNIEAPMAYSHPCFFAIDKFYSTTMKKTLSYCFVLLLSIQTISAMELDTCANPLNYFFDGDGDGFGTPDNSLLLCNPIISFVNNADDCLDNNAFIFPGANEACDETDNNCDGEIDEYVQNTYYIDTDMDGFGNVDEVMLACDMPFGYVNNGDDCDDNLILFEDVDSDSYGGENLSACGEIQTGDCNDNDAAIFPFQSEVCNDLDDNCNDEIDEFVLNTYFADADADGYGDATNAAYACAPIMGFVDNSEDCDDTIILFEDLDIDGFGSSNMVACGTELDTDCDDTNSSVNPNAIEIPDNNIDENCDGEISTNITENKAMHLQLFPNPANQWITISAVQYAWNNKLIIVNQVGQTMFDGKIERSVQLNVGDWANGIYNIIIGTETKSFMISR
jgi:hypothetical protein